MYRTVLENAQVAGALSRLRLVGVNGSAQEVLVDGASRNSRKPVITAIPSWNTSGAGRRQHHLGAGHRGRVSPDHPAEVISNSTLSNFSIGYLTHTDAVVRLYLQESFTFRLLTSEASVVLASSDNPSA